MQPLKMVCKYTKITHKIYNTIFLKIKKNAPVKERFSMSIPYPHKVDNLSFHYFKSCGFVFVVCYRGKIYTFRPCYVQFQNLLVLEVGRNNLLPEYI